MKVIYGSPSQLLKINSVDLECYILNDNSRILGKNKLEKALGLDSKSENSLFDFISNIARFSSVSEEIMLVLQTPISFQIFLEDETEKTLLGFNSSVLIALCNCIVKAKIAGFLAVNQLKTAKVAEKVLKGLENKLLHNLIDEASGFTFFKENAKEQFKNYFLKINNDHAFEWVVTFTDSFYEDLFVFMESSWEDLRYNPSKMADFMYSLIFLRIDDKILDDLRTTKPKRSYVNKNGILLNREHPKLQQYNQSLQSFLVESQFERSEFMQLLIKNYPKNTLRENLVFQEFENENLTLFNEKLKIGLMVKK
jgi:P63C domain